MDVYLDSRSVDSYRTFKQIKTLPAYRIVGRQASFPDEYASRLGLQSESSTFCNWSPSEFLFDYQRDIAATAIRKRKYCVFADCGLGKTLIELEFAQAAMTNLSKRGRGLLIVCPLMVIDQTLAESSKWYPGLEIDRVPASKLQTWLSNCDGRIGITNFEAISPKLTSGNLGGLVIDESSMLKSHYGKWGTKLVDLGRGLDWKLAATGTPAPNDRIEYANHAVFMDAFPNVNSFLATYFVNRGQTQERWVLKPHAIEPFYRALSHWSIFLSNPATYGWKDNTDTIPPIHVNIEHVELTKSQRQRIASETGQMFATDLGGIVQRSKLSQISKGKDCDSLKPEYVASMPDRWPNESTIIWCHYNDEQSRLSQLMPDAGSIDGQTPLDKRLEIIGRFKAGEIRTLITKPKILGFGLNLQIATRQVFSGINDSYETYYQAIKRSNRVGSTKPLSVHIPVTELEEPMITNVLRKAHLVAEDTERQEQLFKAGTV